MKAFLATAAGLTSDNKTLVITFWAALIGSVIAVITLAAHLIGQVEDKDSKTIWWRFIFDVTPLILLPIASCALWLRLFGTTAFLSLVALVLGFLIFTRSGPKNPPTRDEIYRLVLTNFLALMNLISIPLLRVYDALS